MSRKLCATTPCAQCPFRLDVPSYITTARAKEIASALLNDQSFYCHKTVEYDEDGDGESHADTSKSLECAGAVIMLEHIGRANQMMRICERIGMYDRRKMKMTAPVARSAAEFIAHHTPKRKSCARKRDRVGSTRRPTKPSPENESNVRD